jgi:hypothetical protein
MQRTFIVLVGCLFVFVASWKQSRRTSSLEMASPARAQTSSGIRETVVSPPPSASDWSVVVSSATAAARKGKELPNPISSATNTNASSQIVQATAAPQAGVRDPLARAALSRVGLDSEAESYWAAAINDPNLSEKEREDLIEDLNEVGFEDPKNPTLDELPLILNRLELIEEYAPFAMDDVNARSFAEAYKDLSNMYQRLTRE